MTELDREAGHAIDVESLQQDITRTRERIAAELHALGTKLSTRYLRQRAREKVVEIRDRALEGATEMTISAGERARGMTSGTFQAIRQNPVPSTMIVIGTGWILWRTMGPRVPALERTTERAGEKASELEASARQRKEALRERAAKTGTAVRHRTERVARAGEDRARRAAGVTRSTFETHPLLVVSGTLLGALGVALLIPSTRREIQAFGPARSRTIEKLRERGREVKDIASTSVREGVEAARSAAQREAQEHHGSDSE